MTEHDHDHDHDHTDEEAAARRFLEDLLGGGGEEVGEPLILGPFDSPEEVAEVVAEIQHTIMHKIGERMNTKLSEALQRDFGGWMALTHPDEDADPHAGLDRDEIEAQHHDWNTLLDSMLPAMDTPVDEWSDGDKLRSLAVVLWAWQLGDGWCVHHDTVQQELLAMADRLDQLDLLERGAVQYDFDPDYQAGLADDEDEDDEGEEE